MKAVGYLKCLPAKDPEALVDVTAEVPNPASRDLRVAVKAVSVNPVDTKVRMRAAPAAGDPAKVLGYDAAGVVDAVGPEVTLFKPGDEVFYAGSITRSGSNAEFHLVDERIVGRKPKSLSFAQAAALPLTGITAWELLFDRFGVTPGKTPDGRALLVIGGAGGVGSMLIQLAHRLTALTVIATASRPESRAWPEARRRLRHRPHQAPGR
jgi:NADPH2:quinone reductase